MAELTAQYRADRYCKYFYAYDHLVTMLYNAFGQCDSLRGLISGMQAPVVAPGPATCPRRSTLSDASRRRPAEFFEDLFHRLYTLHTGGLPDSLPRSKWMLDRLFIMDSTTIRLIHRRHAWVGRLSGTGRKKGGAKAHVLMRAQDDVSCFVRITDGSVNDKYMLKHVSLPAGSIIVLDKGCNNYAHYQSWAGQQVTFITWMNDSRGSRGAPA